MTQPTPQELLDRLAQAEQSYKRIGSVVKQLRGAIKNAGASGDYESHRRRMAERQREASGSARDIGDLPPVVNPARRAACRDSLREYCEQYHAADFPLSWSRDHLRCIERIEASVLSGGLFALAMPRGSGKTTICRAASEWAVLHGHRRFVAFIGADGESAEESVAAIRMSLETNDELLEDFPEIVYPIRKLEGIQQRRLTYKGRELKIVMTADRLVLPNMPNADGAGGIVQARGITGRLRGMLHKRSDGKTVRPDLVILDDPQTDESARSPSQTAARESLISGAVLGLAGPRRKIAGIMPCTVIKPGDLADNLLNRDKHPEWQGERTKMVYSFPTNTKLWERYAEVRANSLRANAGIADATAFYEANRAAMDAGSDVAWPERFNPDEVSALQHAMNLKLQDEAAFWAEYQNEPMPEGAGAQNAVDAEHITSHCNSVPRAMLPSWATRVTGFVDVQQNVLFWMVAAWGDDFTGAVIDYGTFPDQRRHYFTLRDARVTLQDVTHQESVEARIMAGLQTLVPTMMTKQWKRDGGDGGHLTTSHIMVDANWGQSTDTVYAFCESTRRADVMPSHGRFIGAGSTPMNEYQRRPGERVGFNWRVPMTRGRRVVPYVLFDANFWKSFLQARWRVTVNAPTSMALYGNKPGEHRLLADHLTAEYCVRTSGRGREVDEWKLKPGSDNHWLDCLVGCAVGASMQGCVLPGTMEGNGSRRRKKVSIPEHMKHHG